MAGIHAARSSFEPSLAYVEDRRAAAAAAAAPLSSRPLWWRGRRGPGAHSRAPPVRVLQAPHRLADLVTVAAEREAHVARPALPVKVRARGAGDSGFLEDAVAERLGVVREAGHVGVHVEGALGPRQLAESSLRQSLQQHLAVPGVPVDVALELCVAVERRERGVLAHGGGADEEVLRQGVPGVPQRLRHHGPPDPVPSHAVVLGERVQYYGVVPPARELRRRRRDAPAHRGSVLDPVVDLVAHQPRAAAAAPPAQRRELRLGHHRSGGVARAGDADAGNLPDLPLSLVQHGYGGLEVCLRAHRDGHWLHPDRLEDGAVARVPGRREGNLLPWLERREEGEHEAGRAPCSYGYRLLLHLSTVPLGIVLRHPAPQLREPSALRVPRSRRWPTRGGDGSFYGAGWGTCRRLADLQVQHGAPLRLQRPGARQHLHHLEARHATRAKRW
eukprot:CAMPEP_0183816046 /NCGR_PEP_ID=MMETSP0803_2-20130417/57959_1 /TAXON_ID=195967 /ORGANISM="Crustomastix stigmata, Strain CCMP3273" /LENGTH=444 /DNA_ID=CAMNT_0026060907 /DNA_START=184 /DNA_END=1517 /DNA_ORIENTATION=+